MINDEAINCQLFLNNTSYNLSMDEALVTIVSTVRYLTVEYQSLGCWQVIIKFII